MEYRIGAKDVIIFVFLLALFAGPVLAGIDTVTDRINVNFLRLYSGSNFNITDTGGNLLLLFDGTSWVLYDNGAVTANFSYSNTTLNATTLYFPNAITVQGAGWTINSAWTWGNFDQTFDTNTLFVDAANNRIGIGTTDTQNIKLRVAGNAALNNNYPLYWRNVANSDFSVGVYSTGSDDLRIITGGGDRVTISSGGNVGIGTTTPDTFKVEVAGSIGPIANNTYDLGSAARRWRTIYSSSALDIGHIQESHPFSDTPSIGDAVVVDTANSTENLLRKANNMSDIVRGVFAGHGYWTNDTVYNYDENGTVANATNVTIWIEPSVAKFGLFKAKVNGTIKKGDYLLCCTSPGVLGSIRNPAIRSQVLSVHPIYRWFAQNYPGVVVSWTPEELRVLGLGLPTVGVAMGDYNNESVGVISIDLMPQ